QNDETSKETLINTHANYTLIIKNTGNAADTFLLDATEPYSQLVSFSPKNVTLAPDESGEVLCSVLADQVIIEANNLYSGGIPNEVRVNSKGDNAVTASLSLDTDITVTHDLFLRCPDPVKDVYPGDPADFILYVDNVGTTNDKYKAAVVGFDTSALENPIFNPGTSFPVSGSVDAGESTTLGIDVPVLDVDPTVPVGDYWMVIRISIEGYPSIYEDYNFTIEVKQVYEHTLKIVEDRKDADVDEYVDYTLTIKNTGNGLETFTIRATGDYSSLVTLEMTEVNLTQSESIDFDIQVFTDPIIIDREELYGTDLLTPIEVVSKNDPDDFAVEVNVYTRIELSYDFELTSPQTTKEGKPGDLPLQFTLQVRNIGTAEDTYKFRVTGRDEEIFDVPEPTSISGLGVKSFETTTAFVTITSEKRLAIAGTYSIEITADSEEDPSKSYSITFTVKILAAADVEVDALVSSDTGEPGDVVDFTVKISNKGNDNDTFELTLLGPYKDWAEIYDASGLTKTTQVDLGPTEKPGSFVDVIVRVTIPGTGETDAGLTYEIDIKASSKNTEDVSDTATVSTEVESYTDLELDYSGRGAPSADYNPNKSPPKISFRVTNNGNELEDGISVWVEDMPTNWGTNEPSVEPLDPGTSGTFTLQFDIPNDEDGTHDLRVFVKSTDESFSSDYVYVRINITKPNLVIQDVHGVDNLDNLKDRVGNAITISVDVANEGDAKAENLQVKFYEDGNVRGTKSISSIDAGVVKTVNFRWTVLAEEVELKVEVSEVIETDDSDNELTLDIMDLRPDLSFDGEKLNLSKSNPAPGETITLKAFVLNEGGNAEDVVVKFYEGTKVIDIDTIDIDFGEVGEASVEWEVPDKEGESIDIKAEIDLSGAQGDGDDTSKSVKVQEPSAVGVGEILSPAGITGMGIGIGIGIILFIIGLVMGRGSARRRRGPEGPAAGPSFAAFEKEMPEGADKGAMKGPMEGPAPFERPEGEEGEAAPPGEGEGEEEETAAPKEAVRVRCPKCGKVKEVTSTQRPLQIPCECGTTLMLKK
ncbi:MAG: hypothetical protein JSW28_05905, partial [Thermoplasmata archaeon]